MGSLIDFIENSQLRETAVIQRYLFCFITLKSLIKYKNIIKWKKFNPTTQFSLFPKVLKRNSKLNTLKSSFEVKSISFITYSDKSGPIISFQVKLINKKENDWRK